MSKTFLRMFVIGFKQKKATQRHLISMRDADYDYILDEIERHKTLSLNGMWVLIATRNSTGDPVTLA